MSQRAPARETPQAMLPLGEWKNFAASAPAGSTARSSAESAMTGTSRIE
jgi:hypothetical protein